MPAQVKITQQPVAQQAGNQPPQSTRPAVEKELFSWVNSSRPFKKRDREFWMTVVAGSGVIGVILFLIEGAMPVILLIAVLFLFYILSTVEPEKVQYKITNQGVKIANSLTEWNLLTRFWFSNRLGSELLILETLSLTGRLELIIDQKDRPTIEKVLTTYIAHEEAPPTNFDKASNWVSSKLEKAS